MTSRLHYRKDIAASALCVASRAWLAVNQPMAGHRECECGVDDRMHPGESGA